MERYELLNNLLTYLWAIMGLILYESYKRLVYISVSNKYSSKQRYLKRSVMTGIIRLHF